ncbi:hypothetical protein CRENBAI_008391 [Crenichthys baileyi]|uniref:Uncharacterized protein n=1 Tax=Crenichthys baileyi TaxID=28760 RepID=A0AAV9R386_9TELE
MVGGGTHQRSGFGTMSPVNKHKPWIETSYHGVITENTDVVLLDPPLVALDKDAPIPYAGCQLLWEDVRWRLLASPAFSFSRQAANVARATAGGCCMGLMPTHRDPQAELDGWTD